MSADRFHVKPRILSHVPLKHSWKGLTAHILREDKKEVDAWAQDQEEDAEGELHVRRFHIEDLEVKKDGNVVVWGYFKEHGKLWWNCVTPMALIHANTLYGSKYICSDLDDDNDAILPAKRLPPLTCSDLHILSTESQRKLKWVMQETRLHTRKVDEVPDIDKPFEYDVGNLS